jgi:hypothetical protein
MKPIERIAMYLKFRNINPYSFEKKIKLSNGYFSKQLRHLGSVGSDILIKVHEHYPDLNILWVLIGEGQMICEDWVGDQGQAGQFSTSYLMENGKLKVLEEDLEKMQFVLKDKEKIISLYEFMLNNNTLSTTIADTATSNG